MLSVFTLLDGKAGQNYPGHIALTIFWNNILWEDTKILGATYIHTVSSQSRGLLSEILLDNTVAKRKKNYLIKLYFRSWNCYSKIWIAFA